MPSTDSSAAKVPNHPRQYSVAKEEVTLIQTKTRHDFQAQGSAKRLKRLASAKEQGDYGVTLNVRPLRQIAHWPSLADH
jgi:hypothetical protein